MTVHLPPSTQAGDAKSQKTRNMSIEAKQFRMLETIEELGILGIKDPRIGDSGACRLSLYYKLIEVLKVIALSLEERSAVSRSHANL
jgi:hypothetical protein